jgi:hypothetical protein
VVVPRVLRKYFYISTNLLKILILIATKSKS